MPGLIVYNGPSKYDGEQIVAVLVRPSGTSNRKTGAVVQQYILRADIDPIYASRTGKDYAICGNCKHRGKPAPNKTSGVADSRTCYVQLFQGPLQVYKAYKSGRYPTARTVGDVAEFLNGHMLRLGTYGDPASLPDGLNDALIAHALAHTSYTHAHTVDEALGDKVASYSMVSADNIDDAITAHSKGFRTFRVIPVHDADKPLLKNEILCPSTKGIQCIDCRLCNGQLSRAKSIAIVAHGNGKFKFKG